LRRLASLAFLASRRDCPFEDGNLCDKWLAMNMTPVAQFWPVAPNCPLNLWAKDEHGKLGRGIQYPFFR